MRVQVSRIILASTLGIVWGCSGTVRAQDVPWDVYTDPFSDSVCDVVNASNAELVVISSTGELAIVSGTDRVFSRTFVDVFGSTLTDGTILLDSADVFFDDEFIGSIAFADDGDGLRSLWWTSLTGRVVEVDGFTGEPFESDFFPEDFPDVPCDACAFWDDESVCVIDSDADGVANEFDICPNTPFSELADLLGCSCSQLDPDLDGVSSCFDLCPSTPRSAVIVDANGCSVATVRMCGTIGFVPLLFAFVGVASLKLVRGLSRSKRSTIISDIEGFSDSF